MSKSKEPKEIRDLSLDDFDKLTKEIQEFRNPGDGGMDDDSIHIIFYDDGSIRLYGTATMDCFEIVKI